MFRYDICADSETLDLVEKKIVRIQHEMTDSVQKMSSALQRSENFLSGEQFEKAKGVTGQCIVIAQKTSIYLEKASEFLAKLRDILDDYCNCCYKDEQ